ncbi:ferredoxin [Streptosporangium sp. NPDC002544]|uniref:ferredoxin n=1 Tax=unclassified Streptosporangium TaxID=2632669 RepID=UPI00331CFF7C
MRVSVDGDRCVGSGQCVAFAPDVFAQRDDGSAEVIIAHPSADHEAVVREAAYSCPVVAIELSEES